MPIPRTKEAAMLHREEKRGDDFLFFLRVFVDSRRLLENIQQFKEDE